MSHLKENLEVGDEVVVKKYFFDNDIRFTGTVEGITKEFVEICIGRGFFGGKILHVVPRMLTQKLTR